MNLLIINCMRCQITVEIVWRNPTDPSVFSFKFQSPVKYLKKFQWLVEGDQYHTEVHSSPHQSSCFFLFCLMFKKKTRWLAFCSINDVGGTGLQHTRAARTENDASFFYHSLFELLFCFFISFADLLILSIYVCTIFVLLYASIFP